MLQTAFKCIALFCFTLAIIACARTQTSGTESLLPANSKVLVILAHPDDETWMSGTLARLSAEGHSVQVLYAIQVIKVEMPPARGSLNSAWPISANRKPLTRSSRSGLIVHPYFCGCQMGN